MQGAALGQMGQQMGTFDDRLEAADVAVTAYEKFVFLAHVAFVKLICLLAPAPFPFLR